ncbi:MAG: biotin/lipoate A/B protein ligase family protein [Spirochaetes bacterium]|nr:biotin/lipoate A/B protein ligase family protein [Spirochaetota bacterium]
MSFRLILHPRMEGRLAMAIDEALAEAVGEGRSPQVIRLYGFSPPTLSLGRFQPVRGLCSLEALAADGVTLVRRPTGGHAVLHDGECTYSVILSKVEAEAMLGSARKRAVYEFIARILVAGLANLGVKGLINASQKGDAHNPDCFGSAGEYEISSAAGRKLIGSAQMTTRKAILQHGSIPWENPGKKVFRYLHVGEPLDSHVPSSLDEETGGRHHFEQVRDAFASAFRAAVPTEDSLLSPEEETAARRILLSRYASDEWTFAH